MTNLKELFDTYDMELTTEIKELLKINKETILIPNKVEAKLKYFSKKDLATISEKEELAKDLILTIVSNLSDTYYLSKTNYATEAQKEGFKTLNSDILNSQTNLDKNKRVYKTVLELLIKYNIIEKGRNYSKGRRSNEYRLTSTYFGKGVTEYRLKSSEMLIRNRRKMENNLEKVLQCPIAKNELFNRSIMEFPTQEEAKAHLIQMAKQGKTNKRGKKITYLNKRNPENLKDCVFVEDYLLILDYLQKVTIPIIVGDNGGNRVITGFNFMPSVLRPLIKFNGSDLTEADYSCLHPNIVQFIYGGSNTEMITHDKVADYLGITRKEAKIEHLSFFNKEWGQMVRSPLFKYYSDNESQMMSNLYYEKAKDGYKSTSRDCFYFETELMRDNVKDLLEEGISVLYCFDALYVHPDHLEKTVRIMNKNAGEFGLLTRV